MANRVVTDYLKVSHSALIAFIFSFERLLQMLAPTFPSFNTTDLVSHKLSPRSPILEAFTARL